MTDLPPPPQAPARLPLRHRAPRRRLPRWLGRIGTGVAVLLTLIGGQAILRTEPDHEETVAPFYIKGDPGQPVTAGGLRVTLLGTRGATKAGPEDGAYTDTAGIWVIVNMRVEATEETTTPRYVALADAENRTYTATGRFKQPLSYGILDLQPGIPIEGEVAFEVPRDVATSLTLRVSQTDVEFKSDLAALTDIRVPVSDADVSRWLRDPEPARLAAPKVAS
jgi:Domain of unknown function (DUF4352)